MRLGGSTGKPIPPVRPELTGYADMEAARPSRQVGIDPWFSNFSIKIRSAPTRAPFVPFFLFKVNLAEADGSGDINYQFACVQSMGNIVVSDTPQRP